jgi:predicted alpha-1,2-mannosidase
MKRSISFLFSFAGQTLSMLTPSSLTRSALTLSVLTLSPMTLLAQQAPKENAPLSFVDPYIGTAAHGHVFLGASVPFGAVQVGPTNINKGWDWCSGYHYSDSVVKGFSQDHLNGTGIPDLCDILVMPFTGRVRTEPGTQDDPASGYSSHYDHAHEIARPAYYSVYLKDHHVGVELTASERVAFHRLNMPPDSAHIIIDLFEGNFDKSWQHGKIYGFLEKLDDSTLIGYRNSSQWAQDRRIYFAVRTSFPMKEFSLFSGDRRVPGLSLEADSVKAVFTPGWPNPMLKIGISNVSGEEALANIEAEIPGWDFDAVVREGNAKWNEQLQKITIQPADAAQQKVFYTALYHTLITPALYNDADSSYRGADGKVVKNAPFKNYTIFSLWDTYRAFHPLMTLIEPERVNDFVNTMLAIYQQQGKLPVWHLQGRETDCMVGYSAVPVIADAWLKGFHGFDAGLALDAMKASSTRDDYGLNYLKRDGFIPADKEVEAISKGMEYAIDDWCIARMASKMGRTDDAAIYDKRSQLFNRYFDPSTRFMRPVLADGKFITPYNPFFTKNYTEGNGWEYTWLVPQDPERLISLMGGDKAFVAKLDSLFIVTGSMGDAPPDISGMVGMYAQGNEPNHHVPYLYAFAGYQWKSAGRVAHIARQFYTAGTDGLCGNDDAGQMSAWYVLSALGFYPVNPCNGIFVFGTPLVRKAMVQVGEGRLFVMDAVGFGPKNIYIQRAVLNGAPYTKSYIDYPTIMAGGTLQLFMGERPNKAFGAAAADRPVSLPARPEDTSDPGHTARAQNASDSGAPKGGDIDPGVTPPKYRMSTHSPSDGR